MANFILWNSFYDKYCPVRTLSSYQLASWLRQHGYTIKVIDFCHLISTDDLVSITEKYIGSDTLAIGVSSTFWRDVGTRYGAEPQWVLSARARIENKKIHWLLGGTDSSSEKLILDWNRFSGNAEDSLLKWMDENSNKLTYRNLFDITSNSVHFSKDDFIKSSEVLPIELGRGCQFKCRFCAYPLVGKKKGTYITDYNLIKEEFIRNYNEFGTTKYYVMDDTANENEEKIGALANIVQSLPFELSWTGYNRLDLIWSRPDTITTLKDSGLKSTLFGIESFHPGASMLVGKGWNGKHAKDFLLRLKDIWKDDITWCLSFIVGLPNESKDDIEATLDWCIKNKMYNWVFYPLYINQSTTKLWRSEFELNYEKYGYSFPINNYMWESKDWTFLKANEYASELNNRSYNEKYIGPWGLFQLSCLDHSIQELMKKKIHLHPWNQYMNETKDFIDRYVRDHLR